MAKTKTYSRSVTFKRNVVFLKDVDCRGQMLVTGILKCNMDGFRYVYRDKILHTKWDLIRALFRGIA